MEEATPLNILEFIAILRKRKAILFFICVPAVAIAITTSLSMTKIYRSSAVISYTASGKNPGFGSIANLPGFFSPADLAVSRNVGEIMKLLKSKSMAEEVIKNKNLLKVFFENKKPFLPFLESKPPTMWDGIRYAQNHLNLDYDRLSNTIEISFDFRDPEVATDIVNEYIEVLSKRLKTEVIDTAQNIIDVLNKELVKVDDIYLKEKIYQMIAAQIQETTFAESKKYLNFKLIDPPRVPDTKIKPKRRLIVIITFLGSMMIAVFLILLLEHIERLKSRGD